MNTVVSWSVPEEKKLLSGPIQGDDFLRGSSSNLDGGKVN